MVGIDIGGRGLELSSACCVCVNLPTELFLQLQPLKSRHSGYIPKFSSNLNFIFIYYFIFLISGEQSPLLACSIRTGINKDSIYLRRGCSQICTGVKWQDLWRFGNSLWMCGSMGTLVMGTILKRWWETLRNIFAFVKITVNSPFRWWNLALIFPLKWIVKATAFLFSSLVYLESSSQCWKLNM